VNASRAILDHSEQIHVGWTSLAFATDAQSMVVPGVGPFSGIRVD